MPSQSIQTEQTEPIKQPGSANQREKRAAEEHLDGKDKTTKIQNDIYVEPHRQVGLYIYRERI